MRFRRRRLGWLNYGVSPPITAVSTDGTYTIGTYESIGPGPKALKILKSSDPTTGQRTWYYVESRQAIGFDGFLANNTEALTGVLVRTGSESGGNSSYLLDMNPASDSLIWDWLGNAPLVVGQTFVDHDALMSLTTAWVSGTQAAVTVRFELKVVASTDQQRYNRTQSVSIATNVSSAGLPVPKAAVTFIITKANGSVVTATATTSTTGAAVYKLRLAKQDPVGIYNVHVTATKNGVSGSAATSFTVQ